MTVYMENGTLCAKVGTFGLTISRCMPLWPTFERWGDQGRGHYWHASALHVSLWRDTLPPETVGERGVW